MVGPCICHSFCCNFPPNGKDYLAKSLPEALTKRNNTHNPFSAVFWAQTLILASTPVSTISFIKELC